MHYNPPYSGYFKVEAYGDSHRYHKYTPAEATEILDSGLKTKPFFSPFTEDTLHDLNNGNAKASEPMVRYDLFASGLPAMSYAMAPNSLNGMAGNINMESKMTDPAQWPSENHSGASTGRWLHSDMREVALCFLYQMYEEMINLGNLKQ